VDPIQSLQGLAIRNRAGLTAGICGLALVCLLLLPSNASATTFTDPRFGETTLPITGSPAGPRDPTAVDWAPDGRMFVAEKFGRVRVVEPGGIQGGTQETLIDLRSRVNDVFDRGLLGLAVDSNFASNGYLWLVYTQELDPIDPDTTGPSTSVVSRLQVNEDNDLVTPPNGPNRVGDELIVLGTEGNQSCPAPADTLDCIAADYSGHSINTIRSAPDGTLWISNGDSHSNGTIDSLSYRPYDETNFSGKLIHIDRQGRGLANHPFCPSQSDLTRNCTKIYAEGFRNPYRFTLRPGAGPALGDVGNVTEEELDLIVAGGNYGWPCYEGSVRNPLFDQEQTCRNLYAQEAANPSTVREPAWSYPRDQGGGDFGSAIVVGPVYGGSNYPASFNGKLFVGDYVDQTIKVLTLSGNQVTGEQSFATEVPTAVDLAEMPNGDLGYVDINFGQPAGFVRRIIFSAGNQPPIPVASANPTRGLAPLQVQFTGSNSSDPDDDDLAYRWNFGDGTPESTQANPTHTYQQAGTYTARLTVDDGSGSNPSTTVQIEVGDQPTANITSPADGSSYRDGQAVNLQGTGTDPTDRTLSGADLEWRVILHHNTHQHLAGGDLTGSSGSFVPLTDHDADSNYEIRLTATDSDGNSDTDSIEIDPELSRLTFNSAPTGAPITYSGHAPDPAPLVRDAAVGFSATIEAAESFTSGGQTYVFDRWSDGGAQTHQISVPAADTTYTANYVPGTPTAVPGPSPVLPAAPEITRTAPESPANDNFPSVIGSADPSTTVALYSGRRCSGVALTSGSASIFGTAGLVAEVPDDSRTRFWARATGSRGDSPCSGEPVRYVEDSTAPVVEIRRGPSDKTKDRWPTFRFRANERQASFLCRLDRRKWRACDSPKTYRRLALADHVFRVKAVDEAGNVGDPERRRFELLAKRHYAD
jgi:glucose/arabinose dehydrogenase